MKESGQSVKPLDDQQDGNEDGEPQCEDGKTAQKS